MHRNDSLSVKKDELWNTVENYIQENHICSPESIHQCDHVILNAYEFLESVCEIVGYYDYNFDEEE